MESIHTVKIQHQDSGEIYTAKIQKDGEWWIGEIQEISGINCKERTKEELLEILELEFYDILEYDADKEAWDKVSDAYYDTLSQMHTAVSKRDYKEAGRLVRQNLEYISDFLKEYVSEFNSSGIDFNFTEMYKGGMILALLGDDQGLARMREIVTSFPILKPLIKEVNQHQKDRHLFQAIIDAVAAHPHCLQTEVKTLIGEEDGYKVANFISHLEKAGKIVRIRAGRTYKLLASDSPDVPEPPLKRIVRSHRTHQKSPKLSNIDVSSLSYVPLPRAPRKLHRWEDGYRQTTIPELRDYFEVHDAAWQVARIENIPLSERPDNAFRQMHYTNSGHFMIDDRGHAKDLDQIEAAALRYDRVGELAAKKGLLHGVYRVSVHPFGHGLIAMSQDCLIHSYDDHLEPNLETALVEYSEILAIKNHCDIPDDQLKNHIRCVSLSQNADCYIFTVEDKAWCVDIDGNGLWGCKLPVTDDWTQVAMPSTEFIVGEDTILQFAEPVDSADWIYAAGFATSSNSVYLASYSGRVVLVDEKGKGVLVYDIGSVPRRIVDTGDYLYLLTDTKLYVLRDNVLHAFIDTFGGGVNVVDIVIAQTGFGLLEDKRLRWFQEDGQYLGSVVSKNPIRRVYCTGTEMVVETRQRRAIIQGSPKWWE
ncbi:MAG: hypothetical protein OXH16_08280 [Gemmatimonadetes bacterium]|nr:hypothetical protein [Gemmatimonadota bacterium]